jgi:chromosomal replication initiator protein
MDSFTQLLDAVKAYCRSKVNETAYNLWLRDIEPVSFSGDSAVVAVSSEFMRQIVEARYLSLLREGFEETVGYEVEVKVVSRDAVPAEAPRAEPAPRAASNPESLYTFENFIIGPDNRYAAAAAQTVAENPANVYNPLFIYGASGLGKTHLLFAIKNQLSKTRPELKVLYISTETLTNELVTAIRLGTTESMRQKYRNVDVLLVDDVQFLSGKEQTQEEFFHTFNALHEAHRQVVLTSDRPPKDIKSLEERLRTRFEWGLMTDVQPPDIETRISIIQSKSLDMGFSLSPEVAEFIAKQLKSDVRQLEGVVKKLYAFRLMDGTEPTIEMAQSAIADIVNETVPWPATVEKIISEVGRTFNVSPDDMKGKSQKADVSQARQIAMYIIREVTGNTMGKIGEEFGKRDHATVVYGISKIESTVQSDPRIRAIVQDIIKNCQR